MNTTEFSTQRDNLTIRGKVYGKCEGLKPAVILSHAFMANMAMCDLYAMVLAQAGYICFTYDFCGGCAKGSSDGNTYDMSLLTEVRDLEAVLKYVQSLDCVDNARISLLGCSQGGVVSALVAKKHPDEVDKLLMFYPALCIADDARSGSMLQARFDPDNVPDRIQCGPMTLGKCYVEDVKDLDIYEEITGFNKKVFLIHGTADRVVNVEFSRKARACYSDLVYNELEGADHGFRGEPNEKALELLMDFMKL